VFVIFGIILEDKSQTEESLTAEINNSKIKRKISRKLKLLEYHENEHKKLSEEVLSLDETHKKFEMRQYSAWGDDYNWLSYIPVVNLFYVSVAGIDTAIHTSPANEVKEKMELAEEIQRLYHEENIVPLKQEIESLNQNLMEIDHPYGSVSDLRNEVAEGFDEDGYRQYMYGLHDRLSAIIEHIDDIKLDLDEGVDSDKVIQLLPDIKKMKIETQELFDDTGIVLK